MQYNYHQGFDEFVKNPSGVEGEELTGNRVIVTQDDDEGTLRFNVQIDDQGHVLAALNRLTQRLVPNFRFPLTRLPRRNPKSSNKVRRRIG